MAALCSTEPLDRDRESQVLNRSRHPGRRRRRSRSPRNFGGGGDDGVEDARARPRNVHDASDEKDAEAILTHGVSESTSSSGDHAGGVSESKSGRDESVPAPPRNPPLLARAVSVAMQVRQRGVGVWCGARAITVALACAVSKRRLWRRVQG